MDASKAARIGRAIAKAELIIIGASNGIDIAEGLDIFRGDAHFREAYGDLAERDDMPCILAGLSAPDARVRTEWTERFRQKEYLEYEPSPLMATLRDLTSHAETFVITCNIDGHFMRGGFDEKRVLETEGSVRGTIDERRLAHPDTEITARLEELERLVRAHRDGNVVVLELGVGLYNGIIKRMLVQVAGACPHATYIVLNYNQAIAPDAACESILVDGDMAAAIEEVTRCRP